MHAHASLRSWSADWRSSTRRTRPRFPPVHSFVSTRNSVRKTRVSGSFLCAREIREKDRLNPFATLATIETEMNAIFLEREQAIRELLVSLLARQHCVLIGDPGTGKSAMIEEICARVSDGTGNGLSLFSYLMTKFTQTDEVFGPVSFSGMKNETYHRVIAKRLPDSEIAFLDEIWKSSSAILNAVLKIVNERKFTNGTTVIDVPLMSIFAASNELPEGDDLEAIRDRMLLTHFVNHLSDANFELLMLRKAYPRGGRRVRRDPTRAGAGGHRRQRTTQRAVSPTHAGQCNAGDPRRGERG